MAAGSIILDLLMRTGSFETDTDRAGKKLRNLRKDAEFSAKGIKEVFAGSLLAGFAQEAIAGLAQLPGKLLEATAGYQGMAEKIGDTAVDVAALQLASDVSGVSLDSVAAISAKLTAGLSKTEEGVAGVDLGIKALGLNLEEFKRKSPVERIEALAKAFAQFEDDAGKTAVAMNILGKSGAEQISFFNDLAAQQGRTTILTEGQIAAADKFTKQMATLTSTTGTYTKALFAEFIPVFAMLLGDFTEGTGKVDRFTQATNFLKAEFVGLSEAALTMSTGIRQTGLVLGAYFAVIRSFWSETPQTFKLQSKAISDALKEDLASTEKFAKESLARIKATVDFGTILTGARADASTDPRSLTFGQTARPSLNGFSAVAPKTAGGASDDPTKKLLDNQLKALADAYQKEKDLAAQRVTFLDLYNGMGLVSIRSYYETQQTIQGAALSAEVENYDKQLTALRKYRASAAKETEKAAAQGKIDDLVSKRAQAIQEAGAKGIESSIKQQEEERKLETRYRSLNGELLEMTGRLGEAAAIRFDTAQYDNLRAFAANGNMAAIELLATLRELTVAQADYSKQGADSAMVLGNLALAEDRLALSVQTGAVSELTSLQQLGTLRQDAVKQLESIVAAQEAIAKASGNPMLIQNAERARVELDKLKATMDPLADSMKKLFEDSANGPLADFINGTKSASDAFDGFLKNVAAGLAQMAVKQSVQAIWNGFGGGGGGASGGSSGGDWFSKAASVVAGWFGGGKATGGDVMSGREYWVGENGPEKFRPRTMGTIIPNETAGGRSTRQTINNINVALPPTVTKQTGQQAGAQIARELSRANSRNN